MLQALSRMPSFPRDVRKGIGQDIYTACEEDDVARVRELALQRTSASIEFWTTVLHAAAREGARDVAGYCLRRGAIADSQVLGDIMCNRKAENVYRLLLEKKAIDPNLELDRWGPMVGIAAVQHMHDRVLFLLKRGADPNRPLACYCHVPVLTAAAGCSDEEMVCILVDYRARIQGSGALVKAAERGKLETVKLLLDRGADINELGVRQLDRRSLLTLGTPLHKAAENGHTDIVRTLLQAGADSSIKDAKGKTAAEIATEKGLPENVIQMLQPGSFFAAAHGVEGSQGRVDEPGDPSNE